MRQFNLLVFDDWVPDQASDAYYSRISLAAPVGQVDQIAVQAVVDTCDATGGDLTIEVQHSGDGRNWVEKSTSTTPIGALPFSHVFVDNGVSPFLALVRFRIALADVTTRALVRVFVTGRDVR